MSEKQMRQIRRQKKLPTISRLILIRILIFSIVIATFITIIVTFFSLKTIIEQTGKSRVEVLQQIGDSNATNRTIMNNAMESIYENAKELAFVNPGTESQLKYEAERLLNEKNDIFNMTGNDYLMSLILNDGRRFYSNNTKQEDVKSILQSYWYITHFMGDRDKSWNMHFLDINDIESFSLSLGQTIYNDDNEVVGVIIITSLQKSLFKTYMQILNESNKIYILDTNGIAISHSNTHMNGVWMYNMEDYKEKHNSNSYRIEKKHGEYLLISNYYDSNSGWTIVEEKALSSILEGFESVFILEGFLIMIIILVVLTINYFTMRRINKPLVELSYDIDKIDETELPAIKVRHAYKEIYIITKAFNSMLERVDKLIVDIKKKEKEKNKIEYDFLQAQIDPHFMHNTLFSIKSMIVLGNTENALRMMECFIELLRIPMIMDKQFISFEEEVYLIGKYIEIMEFRAGRKVKLINEIPDDVKELLIPRMILQPLVSNSIFHGFSEKDVDAQIIVRAVYSDNDLYIYVIDNGEGMTEEECYDALYGDRIPGSQHNHISLKNVKNRVKLIYGELSDMYIDSELGIGTAVALKLSGFSNNPLDKKEGK